jgi:hypothetical protein
MISHGPTVSRAAIEDKSFVGQAHRLPMYELRQAKRLPYKSSPAMILE